MTTARAVTLFGIVTVVFWLSHAFLPTRIWPFAPLPNFGTPLAGVEPWIREQLPALNRPDAEVIAKFRREFVIVLATSWLVIGFGIASGVLVAVRQRAGRWLALGLCAALLFSQGGTHVRALRASGSLLNVGRYVNALATYPPMLGVMLLNLVFSVLTLAYLTRRSVAGHFTPDPPNRPPPARSCERAHRDDARIG